MAQQFPNEYAEYKKRTKELIPFMVTRASAHRFRCASAMRLRAPG